MFQLYKNLRANTLVKATFLCSAFLLLGICFCFPAEATQSPIHTWANGNIVHNAETHSVYISGEVSDKEIIESRLDADAGWTHDVQYLYIEKGTVINCVWTAIDLVQHQATLFGGETSDKACDNLELVYAPEISFKVEDALKKTTTQLLNIFYGCSSMKVLDVSGWDISELSKIKGWNYFYGTEVAQVPYPSVDMSSWKIAPDQSSQLAQMVLGYFSSITISSDLAQYVSDFFHIASDIDCANYYAYYGGAEDTNPYVFDVENKTEEELDSEWQAYFSAPEHAEKPTTLVPRFYSETKKLYFPYSAFIAQGGTFPDGSYYKISSGESTQTTELPENPTYKDDSKVFLGWSSNPEATKPEIPANNPTPLPDYGLAKCFYFAVYEDAPSPDPGPEPSEKSGWKLDDTGWRYFVEDVAISGWMWIDDAYGAHWYFFGDDTYMVSSSWLYDQDAHSWYWVCSTGPMITGLWQWIDNEWYGFWWDGKMCTGWVWDIDWNAWFYCYQNGIMARNTWQDAYYLDWRGVWLH